MTRGGAPDPGFVFRQFGIEAERPEPLGEGLINRTFLLRTADGSEFVLQRVNPIFGPEVHDDIAAVTAHVLRKGLVVPRLVPARDGALCARVDGEMWRLMNRLPGESRSTLRRPAEAEAAGEMLGRFHSALLDLNHDFRFVRTGVHDTQRHLDRLRDTLRTRHDHPRFSDVEPLGRKILDAGANLPALTSLPPRIVHGDPKINNFLFEPGTDRVLGLVDMDTLSRMPLPLELGDAFRSWCNRDGENSATAQFSADLLVAAAKGVARHSAAWMTPAEIRSIVPATLTICVELAARFCADAVCEDFFAWDERRFASHSEHSQVRAAGQLSLSESLRSQMPKLEADLNGIFAAAGAKL